MSKAARGLQGRASNSNWTELVKMLFRTDPHGGRKQEILRLFPVTPISNEGDAHFPSYTEDQWQYLLFLLLVISIAEKRTGDMYARDFAERCDSISKCHDLKDHEYWDEGKAPIEWNKLNEEFEKRSLEILLQTLNEYQQQEIATLVIKANGLDEFFLIIRNIRAQFMRMLKVYAQGDAAPHTANFGSIPETLHPFKK
jgi:hypothetical protein